MKGKKIIKILLTCFFIIFCISFKTVLCYAAESQIHEKITTIELQAKITHEADDKGDVPIVTLKKGTDYYEALYVSHDTHELKFKDNFGEVKCFCDADGNKYTLNETSNTQIAIIYDDILGVTRYCINGKTPFYESDSQLRQAFAVVSYNNFNNSTGGEDIEIATDFVVHSRTFNINDSGTSEVLAFQTNGWDRSIRILAGVDIPWYNSVGFELKTYVNDTLKSVKDVKTTAIYERLVADDKDVNASDYGYNYFSALVIKEIRVLETETCYIIARPYTEISDNKFYGSATKINVTDNGYEFDKNYKNQFIANDKDSFYTSESDKTFVGNGLIFDSQDATLEFSASFLKGELYLDIAVLDAIINNHDCLFNVYVDGEFITAVTLGIGRNNVFLTEITEGNHTVKLEKKNGYNTRVYGFTYVENEHVHKIDATSAWSKIGDELYVSCVECKQKAVLHEASNAIFELTFEENISDEASKFDGFTLVNPNGFKIGTDTDGDRALHAGTASLYIDMDQNVVSMLPYFSISFDITITKKGNSGFDASLLTLISNFRNGSKVSGKSADYEYFVKYNTSVAKFATVKSLGNTSILNSENSVSILVGTQYKITAVVDNINHCAHVFVDDVYIGVSEKAIVDMSSGVNYPSFKFNDGGNFYPIFDNFKIVAIK